MGFASGLEYVKVLYILGCISNIIFIDYDSRVRTMSNHVAAMNPWLKTFYTVHPDQLTTLECGHGMGTMHSASVHES